MLTVCYAFNGEEMYTKLDITNTYAVIQLYLNETTS